MSIEKLAELLEKRGDKFEIFYMDSISSSLEYRGGKLSEFSKSQEDGFAVRFVKDKKQAFYVSGTLENLEKQVEEIEEIASIGDEKDIDFHNELPKFDGVSGYFNGETEDFNVKDCIDNCDKTVAYLTEKSEGSVSLSLGKYRSMVRIINSAGFDNSVFYFKIFFPLS